MNWKQFSIISCLLLIYLEGLGQEEYSYSAPVVLGDGWETADMNSLGVDTSRFQQLFSQLHSGKHKIHSMLLVRNGQLILEEYFNGNRIDDPHDLRSVSKSFRSLLLGIAIDQGFIANVDDTIFQYLPNLRPQKNLDPRKFDMTIQDLLTMSSGLDCNDWDPKSKGQEDRVYKKKDWLQYTLDLPVLHDPGTFSSYCSMGIVLIAEIISQASGMSIDQFAQAYLFDPLGITNAQWKHTSKGEVLPSARRLHLTSRDLAKAGLLVYNRGKWQHTQVVSESWIAESTSAKTKLSGLDYGYLWWQIPFKVGGQTLKALTATGNGGQYIFVIPDMELVAVFTGGAYNSEEDKLPFAIMRDVVLPTFLPLED